MTQNAQGRLMILTNPKRFRHQFFLGSLANPQGALELKVALGAEGGSFSSSAAPQVTTLPLFKRSAIFTYSIEIRDDFIEEPQAL